MQICCYYVFCVQVAKKSTKQGKTKPSVKDNNIPHVTEKPELNDEDDDAKEETTKKDDVTPDEAGLQQITIIRELLV